MNRRERETLHGVIIKAWEEFETALRQRLGEEGLLGLSRSLRHDLSPFGFTAEEVRWALGVRNSIIHPGYNTPAATDKEVADALDWLLEATAAIRQA